jgi:glycosyltransferase involved in cell wall biosynthesis
MANPTVSFVVPCYKLAHLLPECVNTILSQTYSDLEVLIMDDCSPDNTAEVARSFQDQDPRVKHIRNDPNLGHLRNYNKGIGLTRGKYVWLISADDYLRSQDVLEKFVSLLDRHPTVGYAFCPGFGVGVAFETQVLGRYSLRNDRDRIIPGRSMLKKLRRYNFVLAASGMARRECYDKVSLFPLDMPWAGDWYLWCVFALHYDVGYFAEPMVCYRKHELSMTNLLWEKGADACCEEDVAVPWAVKQKADEAGLWNVSKDCLEAVGEVYARNIARNRYGMSRPSLTLEEFEKSLCRHSAIETERTRVRARVYASMGDEYYWRAELVRAKEYYQMALKKNPRMLSIYAKKLLLSLGKRGDYVRERILSVRG